MTVVGSWTGKKTSFSHPERLATLCIMEAQLKASLKYDSAVMYGEFQGGPQLGPMIAGDGSLSDSCTSDSSSFSSLDKKKEFNL